MSIPTHTDECAYVEHGTECDCGLWAADDLKSNLPLVPGPQEHEPTAGIGALMTFLVRSICICLMLFGLWYLVSGGPQDVHFLTTYAALARH